MAWDGTGRVWDVETGDQLLLIRGVMLSCALHPDGTMAVTGAKFSVHDISLDSRNAERLTSYVGGHPANPWQLVGGRLVVKEDL